MERGFDLSSANTVAQLLHDHGAERVNLRRNAAMEAMSMHLYSYYCGKHAILGKSLNTTDAVERLVHCYQFLIMLPDDHDLCFHCKLYHCQHTVYSRGMRCELYLDSSSQAKSMVKSTENLIRRNPEKPCRTLLGTLRNVVNLARRIHCMICE